MHLIKSNKSKVLLCTLLLSNAFSNEILDENILSKQRQETFILENKQIKENSNKLKKDWINPISLSYKKNLGEDYKNEKTTISVNQTIFQSGGIYEAIKYANSSKNYANFNLEQQKVILIKNAYNLLFSIKKINYNIEKSSLLVKNAQIDVNRKKEQVLNGFLDSSFLDNALLSLNQSKLNLVDLKFKKKELINSFDSISSASYESFTLPKFKMIKENEYVNNSLELKKIEAEIIQKKNFSYMTKTRYLPTVNAFYNYSKDNYTDSKPGLSKKNSQNYGLSLNVSLDTRAFNEIQSKKIDYLKAKLSLANKKNDEILFFKNKINTLELLDEKIKITKDDLLLYNSILSIIKEEKEAELKTQSDLDTLENSQKIKSIDLKIYKIDKQMELLELYAKLH